MPQVISLEANFTQNPMTNSQHLTQGQVSPIRLNLRATQETARRDCLEILPFKRVSRSSGALVTIYDLAERIKKDSNHNGKVDGYYSR